MKPLSAPREPGLLPWLLAALVLVAYLPVLRAPFVFDDAGAVVNNPSIRSLGWAAWSPPEDGSTTTGRPFTNVSFAVTHALGGGSPAGHRAGNIALHVAATVLLAGLLVRLASGLRCRWWAAATALLWALHPLQTESVAGIAQRTEVLVSVLYLLTLYGVARRASGGGGWTVVSVAACALGMASKEVMVTAPLVAFLLDATFLAGSFRAAWRERRGLYLGLAATWLILAWLVLGGGGQRGASAGFGLGVTPWSYLLRQAEALVTYVWLSLWPHPLVLDYGTAVPPGLAAVWPEGVAVLIALGLTGWSWRRQPAIACAASIFFLVLAPSSSFVPLVTQTMAEHRMYLALAVPLAGLTWLLGGLPQRTWALALLAGGLCAVTVVRLGDYRTARGLWADTAAKVPGNARAWQNLGFELQREGRWAEAGAHYARAIALDPRYVTARYNAGVVLLQQDRWAEAEEHLRAAVALAPDHADARVNLGNALLRLGRREEAVAQYEAALRLAPAADARYNLAVAWQELGRPSAAMAELRRALADGLDRAEAHARLGRLLGQAGEWPEAERELRTAVRLDPRLVEAWANLGNVLLLQEKRAESVMAFEAALRLRPGDPRLGESLRLAREAVVR